ncbi:MAG: LON peptidase substrate-binding domain-containing protein [Paracoccaceae bacterium]
MTDTQHHSYPVLPLRDIVVFPHMVVPLFVGREKSVRALEEVMQEDKQILLAAQVDPSQDEPETDGIDRTGVLANVLQLLKLPDGTVKVLVEGRSRVKITAFVDNPTFFEARAEILHETPGEKAAVMALLRSVTEEFERYAKIKKNIPEEAVAAVADSHEPNKLADLVAGHLGIDVEQKQELLDTLDVAERLEKVYGQMQGEMSVLQVEKKIKSRVKTQMERTQREYYLNEQMKAIQRELGDGEDGQNEIAELEERAAKTQLSKEARDKVEAEIKKLKSMSPMSAEATVVRNYLDWSWACPGGQVAHQEGPGQGPGGAGCRPLRTGKGQGADRRIPRRAGAFGRSRARSCSLSGLRVSADLAGAQGVWQRHGARVHPHFTGRCATKAKLRPPADLYRFDAGQDHSGAGKKRKPINLLILR